MNEKLYGRKIVDLGKINYMGTGKRYPVDIKIEIRERGGEKTFTIDPVTKEKNYTGKTTPKYIELSICGNIWNTMHTDVVCAGQCLDTMYKFLHNDPTFKKIYKWWKKYHLNGMHAGTIEQEKVIDEWKKQGNKYDYTAVCDVLKQYNMYEVLYTGKSVGKYYDNELYRYGSAWLIQDIPGDDLQEIKNFIFS